MAGASNETLTSVAPRAMDITQALEGASRLLMLLEEKADEGEVAPSELRAIRSVVDTSTSELNQMFAHC